MLLRSCTQMEVCVLQMVSGQPAPGTTAASNYADFLSQNGVNVVGKEMTVAGPLGTRKYNIVVRDASGNLQGIEIKTGTAWKNSYQDFFRYVY